jgi:hypothetical protein
MDLPRTFVGYSSTDLPFYQLMTRWKETEGIDFDFCDCQLHLEEKRTDEFHVKAVCRERIRMAGAYVMLVGADTFWKDRYVQWEAQVAREKGCKMIVANLNHKRLIDVALTPPAMQNSGALFVPFSPLAVMAAMSVDMRRDRNNYELTDEWYEANGYVLEGETAIRSTVAPAAAETATEAAVS